MTYSQNNRFAKIKSKRLSTAIVQITGKDTNVSLVCPKPQSRPTTKRPRKKSKQLKENSADGLEDIAAEPPM